MAASYQADKFHVCGPCWRRYRDLLIGACQFGIRAAFGLGGWDLLHGAVVITVRAWFRESWRRSGIMDGFGRKGKSYLLECQEQFSILK